MYIIERKQNIGYVGAIHVCDINRLWSAKLIKLTFYLNVFVLIINQQHISCMSAWWRVWPHNAQLLSQHSTDCSIHAGKCVVHTMTSLYADKLK